MDEDDGISLASGDDSRTCSNEPQPSPSRQGRSQHLASSNASTTSSKASKTSTAKKPALKSSTSISKKKIGKAQRLLDRAAAHERILKVRSDRSRGWRASVVQTNRQMHLEPLRNANGDTLLHVQHGAGDGGSTSSSVPDVRPQHPAPCYRFSNAATSAVASDAARNTPLPHSPLQPSDPLGRTPTSSNCSDYGTSRRNAEVVAEAVQAQLRRVRSQQGQVRGANPPQHTVNNHPTMNPTLGMLGGMSPPHGVHVAGLSSPPTLPGQCRRPLFMPGLGPTGVVGMPGIAGVAVVGMGPQHIHVGSGGLPIGGPKPTVATMMSHVVHATPSACSPPSSAAVACGTTLVSPRSHASNTNVGDGGGVDAMDANLRSATSTAATTTAAEDIIETAMTISKLGGGGNSISSGSRSRSGSVYSASSDRVSAAAGMTMMMEGSTGGGGGTIPRVR